MELRLLLPCALIMFTFRAASATPCVEKSNTTCEECLKNVSCLWCKSTKKCVDYPVRTLLPPRSLCPLDDARWGLCWVNFQALIISLAVIGGVILITIFICCYCCCKCKKTGARQPDATVEQNNVERKARQEERRAQMKARHDEIRKKYGLSTENPYARFENN